MDQVQLKGMLLSCVIGIHPNERNRKQPVTVDLCLYLDTRHSAASCSIQDTVDYSFAVKEVSFILEQCEFLLIETAVETVCKYFLSAYQTENHLPQVEATAIRISKPSALTHGIIPTVQILRQRPSKPKGQTNMIPSRSLIYSDQKICLVMNELAAHQYFELAFGPDSVRSILPTGKFVDQNQQTVPSYESIHDSSKICRLTNNLNHCQYFLSFEAKS